MELLTELQNRILKEDFPSQMALMDALDDIQQELIDKYIPLPLDINGDPIRVGDIVDVRTHNGDWYMDRVVAAVLEEGCYVFSSIGTYFVNKSDVRHKQKKIKNSAVEKLLREFGAAWDNTSVGGKDEQEVVSKYAAMLRLVGENEL